MEETLNFSRFAAVCADGDRFSTRHAVVETADEAKKLLTPADVTVH